MTAALAIQFDPITTKAGLQPGFSNSSRFRARNERSNRLKDNANNCKSQMLSHSLLRTKYWPENLTLVQHSILDVIVLKTAGFKKEQAWITYAEIEKLSMVKKTALFYALKFLDDEGFISRERRFGRVLYRHELAPVENINRGSSRGGVASPPGGVGSSRGGVASPPGGYPSREDSREDTREDTKEELTRTTTPNQNRSKSKSQKKPTDEIEIQYPLWLDKILWNDYKLMRAEIKKPCEGTVERYAIRELAKLVERDGFDQHDIIGQSIASRWIGLFAPKSQQGGHKRNRQQELEKRNAEVAMDWLRDEGVLDA